MRRGSMRPWALSRVSASRRSGGGSAEGGIVAEGGGDVLPRRGLAGLDREEIMAARVADLPACPALREDRVAGDDRALGRQALRGASPPP